MHADSQKQRFIGTMTYFELRVTRAEQVQSEVGDLTHVTVAIATRKAAYHHVWVTDRFHLQGIQVHESSFALSLWKYQGNVDCRQFSGLVSI